MQVEIVKNGVRIVGPIEYNQAQVAGVIGSRGGDVRIVPVSFSSTFRVGDIYVKRVVEDRPQLTRVQRHVMDSREEKDTEIVYHYAVAELSVEDARRRYIDALSLMHENYERNPVEHRGAMIKTDLEARINLEYVLGRFVDGSLTAAEWRGKEPTQTPIDVLGTTSTTNKRIPITSTAEMTALRDAVSNYLALGFYARSTIEDAINAADLATLSAMDVRTEWENIVSPPA